MKSVPKILIIVATFIDLPRSLPIHLLYSVFPGLLGQLILMT